MVVRTNLAVINEHITKCRLRKRCIKARRQKIAFIKAHYLDNNIYNLP